MLSSINAPPLNHRPASPVSIGEALFWRRLALPFPARITLARPLLFPLLVGLLLGLLLYTPALSVLFHFLIDLALVVLSWRGRVLSVHPIGGTVAIRIERVRRGIASTPVDRAEYAQA